MRENNFFRIILLLPYTALLPLAFGLDEHWLQFAYGILIAAAIVGGGPYALLVLGIWIWSRGRDVITLRNVILASPFMQAGIQILIPAYFMFEQGAFQIKEFFFAWFFLMPFAIGVGYFYVALMFLIYALLRWAGAIKVNRLEPLKVE